MCKPSLRTRVNLVSGLYTYALALGYWISRLQREEAGLLQIHMLDRNQAMPEHVHTGLAVLQDEITN